MKGFGDPTSLAKKGPFQGAKIIAELIQNQFCNAI